MSTPIETYTNQILSGDAESRLKDLPDNSIHLVVTSPPYWNMRDYDHDDQIGLEDSVDDYIEQLSSVGKELKRVLRPDGSLFLNMGDKYGSNKNKLLLPHRIAIEFTDTLGFTCRNDIVWEKTDPRPESVKDRLSTTFEYFFHLTPQKQYWYCLDAIREPYKEKTKRRAMRGLDSENKNADATTPQFPDDMKQNSFHTERSFEGYNEMDSRIQSGNTILHPNGKNPGDILRAPTGGNSDFHFATFPNEVVETPIEAACPPEVCGNCGKPFERTESVWSSVCGCQSDSKPGILLDPFTGSGTACKLATEYGRRFIGIELNEEYAEQARERL